MLRGVGGSLEGNVALFDIGHHIVGDRLHVFCSVLDGQPLYIAEDHLALVHRLPQQILQHPHGLGGYGRADAVPSQDAYPDGLNLAKVGPLLVLFEALHPVKLLLQNFGEVGRCPFNGLGVCQGSSSGTQGIRGHYRRGRGLSANEEAGLRYPGAMQ